MTQAVPMAGGWCAFYRGRDRLWRVARDANELPIICETENLALSVAKYRRNRIRSFR